jgi:hypothetical protein
VNLGTSLVSGAAAALAVEAWWKPRYGRKRAAVLLRAEIQRNRELIEDRLPKLDERVRVWRDFRLPRIALDATLGDLGYLPTTVAQAVIGLYHDYAAILRAYELQVEAFEETRGEEALHERKVKNFQETRLVLTVLMTRAIKASASLEEQLETEAARSLWPGRRPRLA